MPNGTVQTVTRGVLKVSHRKLDPKLSTPERPIVLAPHGNAVRAALLANAAVKEH